jgi:hypothetical protein
MLVPKTVIIPGAGDKADAQRVAEQKALADKLAADRAAADKAAAEKAAAEKAAAADKAAADKAAANQKPWVGNWISADPQTRFITKLVISRKGQQIVVRAWGACHPTDCDWGLADAMDTGSGLAVHWNQGFKTADMRIQAHGDSVNVSVRSVYTDNSGRAPNTATEDFVRAQ